MLPQIVKKIGFLVIFSGFVDSDSDSQNPRFVDSDSGSMFYCTNLCTVGKKSFKKRRFFFESEVHSDSDSDSNSDSDAGIRGLSIPIPIPIPIPGPRILSTGIGIGIGMDLGF